MCGLIFPKPKQFAGSILGHVRISCTSSFLEIRDGYYRLQIILITKTNERQKNVMVFTEG